MIASASASATGLRERIAAGDRAALGEAFRLYRVLVVSQVRKAWPGRSDADIDDLVQETFLHLPQCCRKCRPSQTMIGCVTTAAWQMVRCFDRSRATSDSDIRSQRGKFLRSRRITFKDRDVDQFVDPLADNPEEILAMKERAHHLSELFRRLKASHQRVLMRLEIENLSPQEVAVINKTKLVSVFALVSSARRELESLAAQSPLAEVFAAMPRRRPRQSDWRQLAAGL